MYITITYCITRELNEKTKTNKKFKKKNTDINKLCIFSLKHV